MGYSPRVAKSRTRLSDFTFTFKVKTSFIMAVSFLTKSIYLTNCNPILENPDHA